MEKLVKELKPRGVLKSEQIISALLNIDRANFIQKEELPFSYYDTPLTIGFGQTISQPYTVVFMLELLNIRQGQIIMDIGSGSGWRSALLAYLVGEQGKVYAFEIILNLCLFGQENLKKYPALYKRVSFFCQNAKEGILNKKIKIFDRIIVAADIPEIPNVWREKLTPGGIMVYPSKGSIFKEIKKPDGNFEKYEFPGFAFVPFV